MGERHAFKIGHQQIGQRIVVQDFGIAAPAPGPQMHLIDRDRRLPVLMPGTHGHPTGILPVVFGQPMHDGSGLGRFLMRKTHRVRLQRQALAMGAEDFVFVDLAGGQAGDKQFPDAGAKAPTHRVAASVPCVEMPDDADTARIGGPDREGHARHALMRHRMGTKLVVKTAMAALGQQVFIHFPQNGAKAIGVVHLPFVIARAHRQFIGTVRAGTAEEALRVDLLQREGLAIGQGTDLGGLRGKDPQLSVMRSQDREGIVMLPAQDRLDPGGGQSVVQLCDIGHAVSCVNSSRIPASGMPTQAGRLPSSYPVS